MPTCRRCGAQNPEEFRFCGSCGASLELGTREEERKVVSVLFVDLVGFTSQADRADPEDVRAVLRPYHALLRREIDRWGGTLEKFVGDAVMAVFGAPTAYEDDPERAVRAALRIIEALPELNEEHGLELEVRAGIDTGEALVTLGARPAEGEAMAAGDVVNTASRLQAVAPVGGIVVGDATYRATREVIDYARLEPVRLKGKADPVPVWKVTAARSRFGPDVERPRTPFVGREDDLAVLQQAYRRALREHSVQLVTITGEPGVGKTRLVTELRTWVDDQREIVFWRQGRCLPYGDGVTFWALGEIVKAHTGIQESDGPEQAGAKLAEAVDAVLDDARDREWLIAALGSLFGLGGEPEFDRSESFAAWRTFLEGVAGMHPLVILIEDVHWADDALLEFLDELLDRSTDVALLILCTARPELYERHPSWGGGKRNSSTVSLPPLSNDETARLISALLQQAVLPVETQRIMLEHAGGNPLYAEEFTKMLVDRGILGRDRGSWAIAEGVEVPVPESVHAIIAARLDTLPSERKSLLHDAAVVGKVFWSGAVAAMSEAGEGLVRDVMHDLARKELVREARRSSVDGQIEYAFWHALIRDVAYGQIPRAARVSKHRAAAAWTEELAGDRVGDVAELLAHHHGSALELARAAGMDDVVPGLEEEARHSLLLAGDRARFLDDRRAEDYYRRALELTPDEHHEYPEILVKLATVRMSLPVAFDDVKRGFEQAIELFNARGDAHRAADAMANLSFPLWIKGEATRARRLAREATELLERDGPSPELASAYVNLAARIGMGGEAEEGLRAATRGLDLALELGLPVVAQRAYQISGLQRCELGDLGGLEDLREGLRLGLELGLALHTANAYVNLSFWVWRTDGPRPASALHREAIAFWARRGLGTQIWATAELCWFLYEMGEWDQLLDAATTVLDEETESGERWQPGAMALTMRSLVDVHAGRTERAVESVPDILTRVRDIGDPQVLVPGLSACAVIEERRGDRDAAGRLAAELAEACSGFAPTWRAHSLAALARVAASVGRPEIARELTEGLDVVATRDQLSLLSARAILAEADQRNDDAAAMHADAAAGWRAFGHVPEEGFSLLGAGRCLSRLGSDAEAKDALAAAREIFSRLGATRHVAEVDRLVERESA